MTREEYLKRSLTNAINYCKTLNITSEQALAVMRFARTRKDLADAKHLHGIESQEFHIAAFNKAFNCGFTQKPEAEPLGSDW